jgi:hypothetical protein
MYTQGDNVMKLTEKSLMVLIAGPYRSGTHDHPGRMAENLRLLEQYALPLYRAGHLPMIGEWVALPIIREAGSVIVGDPVYQEHLYPVASRLLERCDAVLRIPGESTGADQDVEIARRRGLPIFYKVEDVPNAPQRDLEAKELGYGSRELC